MNTPIDHNRRIIEEFRVNQGKEGGPFEGRTLLLHTTDRRSKLERVNPVAYIRDGDRLAIIASKGGALTNPHCYHNLVIHTQVSVGLVTEKFQLQSQVVKESERT